MKIAFFSDIHGNSYALNVFLEQMRVLQPDKLVFCGDVFDYYYDQQGTLAKLRELPNLICIRGNHDQMFLNALAGNENVDALCSRYGNACRLAHENVDASAIEFVRTWPEHWVYAEDNLKLGVFHGSPANPLDGRVYPDTQVEDTAPYAAFSHVFLGHTHRRMERQIGDSLVINVGSLGQPRDGKGSSYLLFDTKTRQHSFHTLDYDRRNLRRDILRYDPDRPQLLEVLYRGEY